MRYIYTMEYYSAIENTIMSFAGNHWIMSSQKGALPAFSHMEKLQEKARKKT
jgi:hypothetical protein